MSTIEPEELQTIDGFRLEHDPDDTMAFDRFNVDIFDEAGHDVATIFWLEDEDGNRELQLLWVTAPPEPTPVEFDEQSAKPSTMGEKLLSYRQIVEDVCDQLGIQDHHHVIEQTFQRKSQEEMPDGVE
jgi:hypothetical protein